MTGKTNAKKIRNSIYIVIKTDRTKNMKVKIEFKTAK